MLHRVEVALKPELPDPIGNKALKEFQEHGYQATSIRTIDVYLAETNQIADDAHLQELAQALFVDPVLNHSSVNALMADHLDFDWYVEIGFKAGVTDNAAKVARENLELKLPRPLQDEEPVASTRAYLIQGHFDRATIQKAIDDLLVNHLIQREVLISKAEWNSKKQALFTIPKPHGDLVIQTQALACESPERIFQHSEERLLALSMAEATAIYEYFSKPEIQAKRQAAGLPAQPNDVELECLAQTWSEHCKHKIFASEVTYEDEKGQIEKIKSPYKSYIQKATNDIRKELGHKDWCLSVFKDNAGVIKFNEDWSIAFKVETHNSPSALDPYGGALTGIVGVNRDSFGTGMGAKLIANTDIFCFGPPDYNKPLPKKLFHPSRIFEGVRRGVEHGGNQSGVPTVNGAIVFDDCFVGKPLVFCGTLSVMPAQHHGQPGENKKAMPGDRIVMCGGRIGKDGIHGATFSSMELDENSPVTAVQIGDPITQKRMFDFLWQAKEENLYRCITDNGAGGLSSSVGEMSEFTGGCELHLDRAPLKYHGLQPWEILISEAQERMTLAVPPEKIERFLELSRHMLVESTDLGQFTESGYFTCYYEGKPVCHLDMDFMHDGVPTLQLKAKWETPDERQPAIPQLDLGQTLKALLGRYNVCSKEPVIRQYDHEVGGASVIKPLMGAANDAPTNSGALRPVLGSMEGVILANGICPKYSEIDTYHMTACAIDEGIRNIIATGGSLKQIAGLDNFCWPDPVESPKTPDGQYKMAQLIRSCKALYDYCTGFGVPLISGKDSMKNDANLDGKKISILPTLLFSAVGKVEDVRKCITPDIKAAGHAIYLIGETKAELGASELFLHLGLKGGAVPRVDLASAKQRYDHISYATEQGWISAMHDCSDGGLAVTLAEMAFGGDYGMKLDLTTAQHKSGLSPVELLFSESQSRLVVAIAPENQARFEEWMKNEAWTLLGISQAAPELALHSNGQILLQESLASLKQAWKGTLMH